MDNGELRHWWVPDCVAKGTVHFLLCLAAEYPLVWSIDQKGALLCIGYRVNGKIANFGITLNPEDLGVLISYPVVAALKSDGQGENSLQIPVSTWLESVIRLVESELE